MTPTVVQIGRTWRAGQLADALERQGVSVSLLGASWKAIPALFRARTTACALLLDSGRSTATITLTLLARALGYQVFLNYFIPIPERYVDTTHQLRKTAWRVGLLRAYEAALMWLPQYVIVDTAAHARMLSDASSRTLARFVVCLPTSQLYGDLPPGPEALSTRELDGNGVFWVGYGHQGFHGVEVVEEAVRLLADAHPAAELHLVAPIELFAGLHGHPSIRLHGVLDYHQLRDLFEQCSIVLGTFGESPRGQRVVPFKFLDAAAGAKCFVSGHALSLSEHFGADSFVVCDRDPVAIKETVVALLKDTTRQQRVGSEAREAYVRVAHPENVGSDLAARVLAVTH